MKIGEISMCDERCYGLPLGKREEDFRAWVTRRRVELGLTGRESISEIRVVLLNDIRRRCGGVRNGDTGQIEDW